MSGRFAIGTIATVLAVSGGLWLIRPKQELLPMPQISTGQMEVTARALLEAQLANVRQQPRSSAAWGRLGATLRSFEFREEARLCLDNAERLEPAEPRWPYLRGLLLAGTAPDDSIAAWRRTVALCGSEPPTPRLRVARLLAEAGRWDEARAEFQALLRAKPGYAPALLGLGQCAQARGEVREALRLAERCANDRSTARAAWSLIGALQQRAGDTNAARIASQRAAVLPVDAPLEDPFDLELSPVRGDSRDLSDRAQRLLQAGRVTEAAPLVQQLAREHPQFAESWLLLGRWQLLGRNPAGAETSMRRHLELEPDSVNGVFQLGSALLAQNRFDEAAAAFERATRLKSDFGPAFYNLGFALAKSGKTREAVAPFREAIRHSPERTDSYVLLADLHVQLGEFENAAALASQAEAISPMDRRLPALREKIRGH